MKNNQLRFKYKQEGSGPPVLCLHGFLEDETMWDEIHLSGYNKVTINLPGHGNEDYLNEDGLIHNWAQLILNDLVELGLENITVIGHSMGGYVAMEMLNINPSKVSVILLNSNFWEDSAEKKKNRLRVAELVQTKKYFFVNEAIPALFSNPELHSKVIQELVRKASDMESQSIANASIAMSKRADLSRVMKEYSDKVEIIQGLKDEIIPIDLMREKCSGKMIYEINSGHMSHIEQNQITNDLLNNLLKKNGN